MGDIVTKIFRNSNKPLEKMDHVQFDDLLVDNNNNNISELHDDTKGKNYYSY
jgi:hypothetical protein